MKKFLSVALATLLLFFSIPISNVNAAATPVGAGSVKTSSTALNVRKEASLSSTVKAKLRKDAFITVISKSGDFYYVKYGKNSYGYCHSSYIKLVSENVMQVKTTSGRLRVRTAPSTKAKIQDYLTSGSFVTILSTNGKFSKILYDGSRVGYAGSDYLVSLKSGYKPIMLSVPDYKQTDSRWANVTLGSSGQTIAKIGCATTALAMTESHRLSKTITPADMSKKLSYTSGGAVYWPANYNISTTGAYLAEIYSALSEGKPVIVGAKKANGNQHYVVVTGVKSTASLTQSSFYINDPGSNKRTTLNEFFGAYPYFYKLLWAK